MNRESIEEILKNIGSEDVPAEVHKIEQEISRDFSKTLKQPNQAEHAVLGDYIMKSRFTKLTVAAAVIILVVLVGLPFVGKKNHGVALADVLAKVEQARAFMYKMKINITSSVMPDKPAKTSEMDFTVTIAKEYGMKWEMDTTDPNTGKKTTQQMYMLPAQKTAFMIMPERKKYMRMEFDDDLVTRMKKQNNDPREMIKQIINCKYTDLGRSSIDGVEVEGFHTTDPAMFGGAAETADVNYTLWVDAKSWLPVRAEMEFKMNEQIQASGVIYDYNWDIAVDSSDFKPVIPEDFTPISSEAIKMPSMSEEAAIEGLKYFGEICGQYPKKLDMISLMQEFTSIKDKRKEKMDKLDEQKDSLKRSRKLIEMVRPIQSLSMFYMSLVQDKKEPVYYGESVGPEDGDKVLLRWKVSEGEYRVIFGNLTTADVTAEKLAELEKLQPK